MVPQQPYSYQCKQHKYNIYYYKYDYDFFVFSYLDYCIYIFGNNFFHLYKNANLILKLSYIPNISPENIQEKLPIILSLM